MDNQLTFQQPTNLSEDRLHDLRKEVLTKKHYLGEGVFEFTDERFSHEAYELLFSDHFVKLYEQDGDRPSLIVGRRGSGKSSYLNNLSLKPNVIPVPAKSWELIDHIENQVGRILESRNSVDVETVSNLWHYVFVCLWAAATVRELGGKMSIFESTESKEFLKSIVGRTAEQIAQIAVSKLNSYLHSNDYGSFSSETIAAVLATGPNLNDIEKSISRTLEKEDRYVIVLLDNPEDLSQNMVSAQDTLIASQRDSMLARKKTFAGLLDFLGRVHRGNVHAQARYCVAAEQFFWLKSVSEANRKNFGDTQLLHWNAGELLSAVAHRYMMFMNYVTELRADERYAELSRIEIYSRDGAIQFFSSVFTDPVINARNFQEDATTYLLRHTQLLPRQLISYINDAIALESSSGSTDLSSIGAESLKKSISSAIYSNAREVLSSYRLVYPFSREEQVIKIIRRIPLIATYAEISKSWSDIGAKSLLSSYVQAGHPQVVASQDYFMRFLCEVGVIGRVLNKRLPGGLERGYIRAEFEYTLPDTLTFQEDDLVALHPLFSNGQNTDLVSLDISNSIGVYPYGTNPNLESSSEGIIKMKRRYAS